MKSIKQTIERLQNYRPYQSDGLFTHLTTASKRFVRRSKHNLLQVCGSAVVILVALFIALFSHPGSASAFGLMTQNDWSGGVGTSGNNKYVSAQGINTSVAGELSLDTGTAGHTWCNTGECNSDWTKRQAIQFSRNNSNDLTDTNIQISIKYMSAMKNDFSDLRFVNKAGDTDLSYFVVQKSDGDWATIIVHFTTFPSDNEDIYMYYGNVDAQSQSDSNIMHLSDNFGYLNSTADFKTKWGSQGSGLGQFNNPKGIGIDTNFNIYVADTGNHRIQKFDSSGGNAETWGSEGSGDGQFESPVSVVYDPQTGHVFVLDSVLNNIQEFNPQGLFIAKFGVSGTGNGQLNNAQALVTCSQSDSLYVANTGNNTIEWFDKSGNHYGTIGGYGSDPGQFDSPMGITITPERFGGDQCRVAVSDTGNHRIQWLGSDLSLRTEGVSSGEGFGSGAGQLDTPKGIAFDLYGAQVLYVADSGNHRVEKFNEYGKYFGQFGSEGNVNQQFDSVAGIVSGQIGGGHRGVWVLDSGANEIQKFGRPDMVDQYQSHYGYEIMADGSVKTTAAGNSWLGSNNDFLDRSTERTTEIDLKMDFGTLSCEDNGAAFGLALSAYDSYINFNVDGQCIDGHKTIYPDSFHDEFDNSITHIDNPQKIKADDFVRFRIINGINGGSAVYFSTDEGRTYTRLNVPTGVSTNPSLAYVLGRDTPATSVVIVRGMIQYDSVDQNFKNNQGIEEIYGGYTGSLESIVYDLGSTKSAFGNIHIGSTGPGSVGLYARTGIGSEGSQDYRFCGFLQDGDSLASSECGGENGARYVQYKLVMSGDSSASLRVTNVAFEYSVDNDAPNAVTSLTLQKGQSGQIVTNNSWFNRLDLENNRSPYITWDAAVDNSGGSGIKGYCLYLGTDLSADITTTSGVLGNYNGGGSQDIDNGGACINMTSQTSYQLSNIENVNSVDPLYFRVMAVDNAGNIQASEAPYVSFRVDHTDPIAYSVMTGPDVGNSKIFSVNFLGGPPAFIIDDQGQGGSGIVGFKYCISQDPFSGFSDCAQQNNWYGPGHTGDGSLNTDGAGALSEGGFTTTEADGDRITDNGANFVLIAVIDAAGNYSTMISLGQSPFVIAYVTQQPPSAPLSLQVDPSSNTQNSFSFSWAHPETFVGFASQINYCYTVNEAIASDGHNCRWTGENITQLSAGPYATQQGTNTLYLMARDKTQNFSTDNVASVNFTATTTAPGAPQNLDLSDVSVRATSSWKLAMSWAAPSQLGSGVSTYKIMRSADGTSFTQVGSTSVSNLSFIDSGLTQITYYYQVKACDNAGNCGLVSNTVSKKPLGRFTVPANLIVGGGRPVAINIGTRKATIQWQTDRESDSRVAIGTSSGQYAADETGNSSQLTDHSINLTNLQPGTQYYYVAKWTDADGNTGVSPERSFMTAPAPSVREARAESLTVSGAAIKFVTKDSLKARVYYGASASFGGVKEINTSQVESNYSVVLSDLNDDTKYFYKVTTQDSDGNEYDGDTYSFTTPALPKITQLRFSPVEDAPKSTLRVTWTTNMPTNSEISYGLVDGSVVEQSDPQLKTEHEIIIEGLVDGSRYSLVARSRNAAGDLATSDRNFFTTALDTRPPKISDVIVETAIRGTGTEARGQITVAWKTDEPSTSQVAFGQGQSGDYTGRTTSDARLTTEHVVVISDLPTSSIYRVRVLSQDPSANVASQDGSSVIIGRAVDNIFSIIFNSLQRIFGL